jgi:hypothetical protein
MFSITINTDDPQVIINIAKAVNNTPPAGFVSVPGGTSTSIDVKPPEVVIHTTEDKVEEAKAAVNVTEEATVKVEEPIVKEEPTADVKAIGQKLRQLLLNVSKLDGKTIQDAKEIAAKGAGVDTSAINKDFPAHPKAHDAIKALEGVLA